MALTVFNYSRFCYIYNIYSGVNKNINKKNGVILKYFDIY